MTHVKIKGLNRVRKTLADGSAVTYWYAWKGGPRLSGKPGSPEFMAAYNAAVADHKAPRNDTLAGLVTLYKSKPEYLGLSASTRKEWSRWLDRISLHDIGGINLRGLEDSRVRADLMDWRDEYAKFPRTADYGVQVLSRVLGFAVERGVLSQNRALGIPHLYENNRADMVWSGADLAAFAGRANKDVNQALRLACATGLRRGDLVNLRWSQVTDLAIVMPTSKSLGAKIATIPILRSARDVLEEIGRKEPFNFVLTNSHGRPWGANSLSHRITHFAQKLEIDRSLHDARGTFATRLRLAGLTEEEIAEVKGWERDRVRRILAKYVDQEAIVRALVAKVERNEAETKTPNQSPTEPDDKG